MVASKGAQKIRHTITATTKTTTATAEMEKRNQTEQNEVKHWFNRDMAFDHVLMCVMCDSAIMTHFEIEPTTRE